TAQLPIVALTAGVFETQIAAAQNAGMNAFVAKPFNIEALVSVIQKHVRSELITADNTQTEATQDELVLLEKHFPGIAVDQGLALWGNLEAYQKFLRKFAQDYADTGKTLNDYLVGKNIESAKKLTHKLKGTAGNLALIDVTSAASLLEAHIVTGKDHQQAIEQLISALHSALSSIALFTDNASKPEIKQKNKNS